MLRIVTPAVTSDLTVLATVRRDLQITGTDEDGFLTDLIRRASDAVTRECNRTTFGVETVEQTERLTRPRACIVLARDIAPQIASVTVDGTSLVAGTDYELDGALLYRLAGTSRDVWTGVVVVSYSAGYSLLSDIPYDLEQSVLLTVTAWHAARTRDPLLRSDTTEGVGSTSWVASDATGGLPAQAVALLGAYRAVVL